MATRGVLELRVPNLESQFAKPAAELLTQPGHLAAHITLIIIMLYQLASNADGPAGT